MDFSNFFSNREMTLCRIILSQLEIDLLLLVIISVSFGNSPHRLKISFSFLFVVTSNVQVRAISCAAFSKPPLQPKGEVLYYSLGRGRILRKSGQLLRAQELVKLVQFPHLPQIPSITSGKSLIRLILQLPARNARRAPGPDAQ